MQSLFSQSLTSAALPAANFGGGSLIFVNISPQNPKRTSGFFLSVILHVLGVLLLPVISPHIARPSDRALWARQQRFMRTLRIRIPEQFYVASKGDRRPQEKKPKEASKVLPPKAGNPKAQAASAAPAPKPPEQPQETPHRRRFQLPPLKERLETVATLLQPQFSADQVPTAMPQLPEVFFWTPQTTVRWVSKPFVTPGHVTPPTRPRLLDAAPKLDQPISEPAAMNVPPLPDSYQAARLLQPPALPIRTLQSGNSGPQTGISADPTPGDPTTVLSLMTNPPQLREYLLVPPGNQVGKRPEAGGGKNWANGANGDGSGRGMGSGEGDGTGPSGEWGIPGGIGLGTEALREAALAAAAASRVVHPASGVFDVVVQSSEIEGFAESAGVLSGRPIFSAYVRVGASKDWILQYCIPGGQESLKRISKEVVRIGSGTVLTAPYPRVTMRPPVRPRPGRHIMVHGFISAEGRVQDLKVLGRVEAYEAEMVLAVVEQWQFRPAKQDGQPVLVEFLLAIPTD
jgi:hypothetical protein